MKDFKKPSLYESEQGRFEHARKNRIETNTEYNQTSKYESGHEEAEDMPTEFLGSAFDGLDSFSGLDNIDSGGFGDFSNFGAGSSGADESWRNGKSSLEQFLYSLPILCKYVFEQVSDGKNTKEEWKNVMKPLQIFGAGLFIVSLLAKIIGFNTLHIPMLGIFVGLTVVAACVIIDYQVYKAGPIAKFKGIIPDENAEQTEGETDDPFSLGGMDGDSDGSGLDFFNMGEDSFGSDNLSFGGDSTMNNALEFNDEQPDEDDYEDEDEDADDLLPPSPVNIKDTEDFEIGLLEQFKLNAKYQGRYLPERKKLLDSFAGLMVTNDKKFSKWITEKEHSVTYDNIGYTIYKALIDINKSFSDAEGSGSKITIMSISSSPLMYKIELRLPAKYFKPAAIERAVETFENYMKTDAADTQVQCLISTSSDIYTFRFLRLDYRGLISIGDILRYKDDSGQTPYEKFTNPSLGAPMLVGLRDNEYPHIVDLEKNTAMAIVGGSGSGKSWLTYELGVNLVTSNDFNEVHFIVLDAKNSTFWKTFARMPHVLGYHSDVSQYVDIAREVEREMERRQEMLGEYDMEDFVEARKTFKKKKQYDKLKEFPLLVFVIDEITSTMNTLEGFDEKKETQKAFIGAIENISQKGRSAGVRLLTIGQRAVNASLPKNVRANSSMLFGMKMNAESDFNILFDGSKKVERMKKPIGAGLGIMTSEDLNGYHNLKTLTPGGQDEEQIRTFLRIMALDWVRRAVGREDLYKKPINTAYELAYNRPKFLDLTYAELAEGRILNKMTVSNGFEVDLLHEATQANTVQRKNENTFTDTQRSTIVKEHIQEPKIAEPYVEPTIAEPTFSKPLYDDVFVTDSDSEEETKNLALHAKKQIKFPDLTDFINNLNLEEDDEEDEEEEFSFEDDESYQHELFTAKKELFAKQEKERLLEEETKKVEKELPKPIVEKKPVVPSKPKYVAPLILEDGDFYNVDVDEIEPNLETVSVPNDLKIPDILDFEEEEIIEEIVEEENSIVEDTVVNDSVEDESSRYDSVSDESTEEESPFGDLFDEELVEGESPYGDLFDEEVEEEPIIEPEPFIEEVVNDPIIEEIKVVEKVVAKAPVIKKPIIVEKPKVPQPVKKPIIPVVTQKPVAPQKPIVPQKPVEVVVPVEKVVVKKEPVIKTPQPPKQLVTPTRKPDSYNTGVKMQFNTPSAKKKETPNISIQQYIIENGVKVGSFDSALPKDVLDNVYTKNQINKSIRAMEIMSTKDSYIASL